MSGLGAELCFPGYGYCRQNVCAFVLCPPRALALDPGVAGIELQLLEINSSYKDHGIIESLRLEKGSKIA